MNTVCALVMGICPAQRLEWLKECINHLEKQPFDFERKIVALDEFKGNFATEDIKTFLKEKNWEVKIFQYHSRSRTMQEVFKEIKEDCIFYIEDDVLLDLPPKEEVMGLFDIMDGDRMCGYVSPQVGGGMYCSGNKIWGDVEFIEQNTLYKSENLLAFKRLEEYKTNFFITFPCALIKTSIFNNCLNTAIDMFKGRQIEEALTAAYFFNQTDKDYYKVSICRPDTVQKLKENMKNERICGFYQTLDPAQGNNFSGGNPIVQ